MHVISETRRRSIAFGKNSVRRRQIGRISRSELSSAKSRRTLTRPYELRVCRTQFLGHFFPVEVNVSMFTFTYAC